MNRIPASRHTASVPPTVVAPSAPWTRQAARSRAPALRAATPALANRFRSDSVSPTRTAPSTMPIVAGTAPASRTRASAASVTWTPHRRGSRARPGSSPARPRAARDRPASCTSSVINGSIPVTASLPSWPPPARPRPGPRPTPPTRYPGGERVARPGRVHRRHRMRRVLGAAGPHAAGTQLHHQVSPGRPSIDSRQVRLGLGAEHDPGAEPPEQRAEPGHAVVIQHGRR